MADGLASLLALQSARGAFPSLVESGGEAIEDETCFVTAQVALILIELGETGAALECALDFVEACACPEVRGGYCFYPPALASPRLPIRLTADADDSALAWLALIRGGRRSRAVARDVLPGLFDRVLSHGPQRGDAPWVRAGVWRTWLSGAGGPADLAVNANILAVLAEAGCADDGRAAAAIDAAPLDGRFLRALAPFYAHPAEVALALDRAVRAGVASLAPAAARLAHHISDDPHPLYCNAHGRPLWRSPALHQARRLISNPSLTLNRARPPCPTCSTPPSSQI